ncbi:Ankyrin repeat protein 2 [Giardia muris]|uniref:Ankyrin repeat protein 2 n=1 Tax=Giardia muris TaxID=5742 RepID=A0A4Z1T1H4_GIAMU|nr:Ankyrin repeat protein 2 [Giardia muris]|eukprot:TNJ26389.1 Ankyrin repeat protein 2 [Giardia muris]
MFPMGLRASTSRMSLEVARRALELENDRPGNALMRAANDGSVAKVQANLHLAGGRNEQGWTALMYAAREGKEECVWLLMDKEARMQKKDGFSALMVAAMNGHVECVRLLMDAEAGLRNKDGRTALHIAADAGRSQCVEVLIPSEATLVDHTGQTALMEAAVRGREECVALLVEKELGFQDKWGWTALMYAANAGNADCVSHLLGEALLKTTRIGKIHVPTTGMTALMLAIRRGHAAVASLLAEYESGATDDQGHDACWHASKSGHEHLVPIARDYRFDPVEVEDMPSLSSGLTMPRRSLNRTSPGSKQMKPTPPTKKSGPVERLSSKIHGPESLQCVICLSNPKCIVLQPCKHCCVCEGCAKYLKGKTCPLCRKDVERMMKIFL